MIKIKIRKILVCPTRTGDTTTNIAGCSGLRCDRYHIARNNVEMNSPSATSVIHLLMPSFLIGYNKCLQTPASKPKTKKTASIDMEIR